MVAPEEGQARGSGPDVEPPDGGPRDSFPKETDPQRQVTLLARRPTMGVWTKDAALRGPTQSAPPGFVSDAKTAAPISSTSLPSGFS